MLQKFDRTRWTFAEALEHVEGVLVAHWIADGRPKPERIWADARNPETRIRDEAKEQLLVALRDGYLLAEGRLSTERNWDARSIAHEWKMHALDPEPIGPRHWHGRADADRLVLPEGEYIDIRMLRVMVLAIWPPYVPPVSAEDDGAKAYTTPYLELMKTAIKEKGISETKQELKKKLVDWFQAQEVEGQPISANLAHAMATLIRLPCSQHGGLVRVPKPEFNRAS